MKFLRANPNLLLKVVPTTVTVDEQGVEMLHKRSKHLNKDLNMVQQPVRAKTASKKRKKIKEITKSIKYNFIYILDIEEQKPYINKSQVLASSEHPIVSKTGAGMDETYYSDSRSINKSHINSSVFGMNEGLGRFVKENKAQNQILNSNPSIFAIKQNAL